LRLARRPTFTRLLFGGTETPINRYNFYFFTDYSFLINVGRTAGSTNILFAA